LKHLKERLFSQIQWRIGRTPLEKEEKKKRREGITGKGGLEVESGKKVTRVLSGGKRI